MLWFRIAVWWWKHYLLRVQQIFMICGRRRFCFLQHDNVLHHRGRGGGYSCNISRNVQRNICCATSYRKILPVLLGLHTVTECMYFPVAIAYTFLDNSVNFQSAFLQSLGSVLCSSTLTYSLLRPWQLCLYIHCEALWIIRFCDFDINNNKNSLNKQIRSALTLLCRVYITVWTRAFKKNPKAGKV